MEIEKDMLYGHKHKYFKDNHPRNTETEEAIFSNTQKDRRQVE